MVFLLWAYKLRVFVFPIEIQVYHNRIVRVIVPFDTHINSWALWQLCQNVLKTSQSPWRASKSLWPLQMHYSSAPHYLKLAWKHIIHYSPHLLLLTSSWASPLLSKHLQPWKFFQCLSLPTNLERIHFGETCLEWKNLLFPSLKNRWTWSFPDILKVKELTKQPSWVLKAMWVSLLILDFCLQCFFYNLFVHRGLKFCFIMLLFVKMS